MTTYTVFHQPGPAPEPVAVPEKFSWLAALVPPAYLLRHALWLGLAGYAVFIVAIVALAFVIGDAAALWVYVLAAVLFGFEAGALRRSKLRRKGLSHEVEIIAQSADLAEVELLKAVLR